MEVFPSDEERRFYLSMLHQCADRYGFRLWAYCLMANHVHMIGIAEDANAMSQALGLTHQRYSSATNALRGWTGNLWANRFYSTVLDEEHLWAAVRYVELNPVRSGLVTNALDYRWSSARSNAGLRDDPLLDLNRPFPGAFPDWPAYLASGLKPEELVKLRMNISTGRPCGSESFIAELEARTGLRLRPAKRGRKPKKFVVDMPEVIVAAPAPLPKPEPVIPPVVVIVEPTPAPLVKAAVKTRKSKDKPVAKPEVVLKPEKKPRAKKPAVRTPVLAGVAASPESTNEGFEQLDLGDLFGLSME